MPVPYRSLCSGGWEQLNSLELLGSLMKSDDRQKSNSTRILYLRTFKDATSDHALIISLAMIIADVGRLVVLGSQNDGIALQVQWQKRFGNNPTFSDHIEYTQSSESQWRRLVHEEISKADCILLFIEAKGRRFPKLRTLRIRKGHTEDFFMGPFLKQSTGFGLLREISYLKRLKKVRRTIILCRSRNASHVARLIDTASVILPVAGNGLAMMQGRSRVLLPHFSALDLQVGNLDNAAGLLAFKRSELKNPHSQFSITLKSTVNRVCSKPRNRGGTGSGVNAILLGRSNKPRRLPPDGERKIIQFTNVEDMVLIPSYELTEVSHDEVSRLLSDEGAARGCPYCKGPLANIFFYVRGLHRCFNDEVIKGRCQYCYGYIGVYDGMLIDI